MESSEQDWKNQLKAQQDEIWAKDLENDALKRKLRLKPQSCDPGEVNRLNQTQPISQESNDGLPSHLRSNFVTNYLRHEGS